MFQTQKNAGRPLSGQCCSMVKVFPVHQRVLGKIPGQEHVSGFQVWSPPLPHPIYLLGACAGDNQSMYLSHIVPSLSLPPPLSLHPPLPLFPKEKSMGGKNPWVRTNKTKGTDYSIKNPAIVSAKLSYSFKIFERNIQLLSLSIIYSLATISNILSISFHTHPDNVLCLLYLGWDV